MSYILKSYDININANINEDILSPKSQQSIPEPISRLYP